MQTSTMLYPKAKKKHRCDWCGQHIQIGEVYEKQSIFDNGSVYVWKNHRRCSELASKLNMFENNMEEGLNEEAFCKNVVEYYIELVNFDRNQKLPAFKQILDEVFKQFYM